MNGIIKSIAVVAIVSFFLSACGGESSGESTGTMPSGGGLSDALLSDQAKRGLAIFQDPAYSCNSCHGAQGEGTNAGGPLDSVSPAACATCGDITTLTAYNEALMPASPYDPATCTGACASDVSQFIIEGFIQGLAIPNGNNNPPPATPDIIVNPTTGLTTTEAGGTASFTVVLNTQPTDNVDITLLSSNTAEGDVNPATLTFTAADWNQLQTVMVTGMDDAVLDGNIAYTIMTTAASNDADYVAINPADVAVTNIDNEVPPPGVITVDPVAGLTTSENGDAATFTIVLGTVPTQTVTIGLSSNNAAEGTVLPASVAFTATNYNVPQTVTVTGVNDLAAPMVDGDIVYSVVTAPAISADPAYSGLDASDVSVTNTDDDVQPVISQFVVDQAAVAYGGMVTLNWASDGDACTAGGANAGNQWTGTLLSTSMLTLTNLTTSGVNTFTLTCNKGGIDSVISTVDVTVAAAPGAPVVTLTSDQVAGTMLAYNGAATLTWTSTGAVGTCTAAGGWSGDKALNDTEVITNLVADTTFDLTCVNSIGTPTTASTTVSVEAVNPALTFTVNNAASATITKGDSVVLAWNPTDLATCTASAVPANAAWTGATNAATASSETIANVQDTTAFTLTCQGVNGANVAQTVNVTANPDPELLLGKSFYDGQCAMCHAADGTGTAIFYPLPIGPNMCANNVNPGNGEVCSDQAILEAYISVYMPNTLFPCDGDCSRSVAKYILNNFSTQ
jgi:mono/diheme cytochrome c family protein